MSRKTKVSIFLVEDHPVVRECLRIFLNQEPNLEICGEADNAKEALQRIQEIRPELVILDISLHASSGFELIKGINTKCLNTKILVFSMHDEKLYAERCFRAGAHAYVMKRESTERLLTAIRDVLGGQQKFAEGLKSDHKIPQNKLSDRELGVLNLLGEGLSNPKIAQTLDINIKTVHAHCANIKQKLGLSTARELLREATKWRDESSAF